MTEEKKTETGVAKREVEIDKAVMANIQQLQKTGQIHFPPDYSPGNAITSGWLAIQEAKDRDNKPALSVCTKRSVWNALFDMVITGLNPAKKQGYFLVYGDKLVFQRSYFGSEALAKRVDPNIGEIIAEPVYAKDVLEYSIERGKKVITKHVQLLENIGKDVKAGYCMIIGKNGEIMKTEIMTWDQIKASWSKSKQKPITDKGELRKDSPHYLHMEEYVRRTVINRACKPIFNSSDDVYLRMAAVRSEIVEAEEEAQAEIQENANNGPVIDIEPEPEGEPMTEEEKAEALAREAAEAEAYQAPAGKGNGQQRVPGF